MRVCATLPVLLLLSIPSGQADVTGCACNHSRRETLALRECSLCAAADAQPAGSPVIIIRDASPSKPNRWLALPRAHSSGAQDLAALSHAERTAYWSAAIAKGLELWGEQWGLAVNSVIIRTQCHLHIHIGRLRDGVEDAEFVEVEGPAAIPLPREGDGLWVHPVADKLHVHHGNDTPELLLLR